MTKKYSKLLIPLTVAAMVLSGFLFKQQVLTPEAEGINWISFEEAVKKSKKKKKKIFIDVYTSWCGWCKRMDATTFKDPKIVQYVNKKFYAVKLNAEGRQPITFKGKTYNFIPKYRSHELAFWLLKGRMSYPTTVYLDENVNVLSVVPGYQRVNSLQKLLHYYGENHHKTTSWKDFQANYKPN